MTHPIQGTRVDDAEREGWSEAWSIYNTERTWSILDEVLAIATATGKSAAQVSLNWLLRQPGVTAPIIGARTLTHLEDNLGATGWALTPEQLERLDRVSRLPAPPYPNAMVWELQRD
jgi:aryl-alcohol dehydrogenase-like predicted oxidoreductase